MSGFAGVISLDGAPPDVPLLERMAQTLAFRGPDGTHITTKPGAGFCFTFLRTGPGPQCSSQPCSLDGKVWLLGDVRLDGRDDLRRKLEQHGDELTVDATDEELVLRAWRRWQEDCLPDLIGDYSFALWDAEARHLCCARDLMGARPFFYAQAGDRLYFSNTLNTIRCAPDITSALDEHFIGDFLLQDWCAYPERTAFRDIFRLQPGHMLRYSVDGVSICRFAFLPIEDALRLENEEYCVEQFRQLLTQAVRERMPDGPTAIFMSGGLDSTSIAALAVRNIDRNRSRASVCALAVDWQPLFGDNEGRLASLASKFLGIRVSVIAGPSWPPYLNWNDSRSFLPEPMHDPYRPLAVHRIRQAAQDARVVFNGYGGDGVLTGQAWPYLVYLLRRLRIRTIAKQFGGYVVRNRRIPPLRGGFRAKVRNLLKPSDPQDEFPQWLTPEFQGEMRLRERYRELQSRRENIHPWYPNDFNRLNGGSWAVTLEAEDAAWNGTATQVRSPFLDLRLQRFLLRLPPVPLCMDKELLRRATRGLLPDEIRLRPKTALPSDPLILQTAKHNANLRTLLRPTSGIDRFVDWSKVEACLESGPTSLLSQNLRPVSLLYWLSGKSLETDLIARTIVLGGGL